MNKIDDLDNDYDDLYHIGLARAIDIIKEMKNCQV